jgi:SNF2 family DNA or RNA helicase
LPIRRTVLPTDAAALRSLDTSPALPDVNPGANWYALHLRALGLNLAGAGERLLAPGLLVGRVEPHPYQVRVVRQVLGEKRPAAILADEVGLGKTIEAGLILKELVLRDQVRSALVIAPKALLAQWQEELRERFDEDFVLAEERRFQGFERENRVICSFQQFVRGFERIEPRVWDCVIVDEAHLLANPDAKRRRCVGELRARWRLLLTATPIQNKITDLYSLVDLARPGRLGTLRQFVAEFAADPATCRAVVPGKASELRAVAREVMCRTRRDETGIAFAPREVATHLVRPEPAEAALNREVTAYLRRLYRRGITHETVPDGEPGGHTSAANRGALIREIVALQQSLSSSPRAIAASLRARAERHADERHADERAALVELAERCEAVPSAKERLLLDTLRTESGAEPVLIFTLRLETARHLRDALAASGRRAACYVGALDSEERAALVARFNRGEVDALVATDAGAEGLNLQERCHLVFNYDLHWNPMKMEQRIGRVHRLGQTEPVKVANFALKGSIDQYVLELLYTKIGLFTMTIGALESVLADVREGEVDIEQRVLDLLLRDEDDAALEADIKALGDEMDGALKRVSDAETRTAEVLG